MTRIRQLFVLTAAAAVFGGCDDPAGPDGQARVQVLLTDAPAEYFASAEVTISRVYLQGGGEEDAAPVDLFNDAENPHVYDLLLLQDGVTADLTGLVDVPDADYGQLRLVVSSAVITLADGYTFSDGTTEKELQIPSGAQSGIKVQLTEPVAAVEGSTTIVVVDFDVYENFVIQGNPDTPAGIHGILFTPVLRETDREVETDEG